MQKLQGGLQSKRTELSPSEKKSFTHSSPEKGQASPTDPRNIWGWREEKLLFLPYAQLSL